MSFHSALLFVMWCILIYLGVSFCSKGRPNMLLASSFLSSRVNLDTSSNHSFRFHNDNSLLTTASIDKILAHDYTLRYSILLDWKQPSVLLRAQHSLTHSNIVPTYFNYQHETLFLNTYLLFNREKENSKGTLYLPL